MATDYHNFPKPARVFDKYWDIFARQLSTDFVDFLCNIRQNRSNLWFKRFSASVQTISRQPFRGVHEPAKQYAVSGLGSFALCGARERAAARGGRKKGMDTYGFHPSFESPRFPWGNLGATERKRSYLEVGPKKRRTAVPLPIHRPQSAIPFTATLKPLELCNIQFTQNPCNLPR